MSKFIRTFYNDEKVIMKLDGCHLCPLMKFNMQSLTCYCRYFMSDYGDSIIDPFVVNYIESGIVNEKIIPPMWCELPNSLEELKKYRNTFRAFTNSILCDDLSKGEDDDKLPFINADELRNKDDKSLDEFFIKLITESFNRDDDGDKDNLDRVIKRDSVASQDKYAYQSFEPKFEVCSMCGEEDESVNRKEKFGMCDECWEQYKDDEEKQKQAYINNFRMKRNKAYSAETFKIIL